MAEPTDAVLVAELREIGRQLDLPAPPDLRAAVRARLTEPGAPAAAGSRLRPAVAVPARRWVEASWPARMAAALVALAVLAGGVLAASPRARAAVADFFRIGPVRVHSGPAPVPPASPVQPSPRFGAPPPDTRTSTLAQARALAAFPVQVPAALGVPDEVLVGRGERAGLVALRYGPGPGRPPPSQSVGPPGLAVELDEVAGTVTEYAEKYLLGDTRVERVDLGDGGWWISAPHELIYLDASGQSQYESARLAERTLIWQRGSVTYRLEGGFSKEQALAVARSLP
jgi:hypothetical protein